MIRELFRRTMTVQILSQLAATLGLVIDGMIIGQFLGVDAIAAYGLVAPVMQIIPAVGGIIVTGSQVLCSGEMGRGEIRECNRVFSLASILTLGFSILTMLIIFLLPAPVCVMLGASEENGMLELSKSYLIGYTIGAPGFIGMQFLMPFMQLDGDRQRTLISALAMSVADVVFDLMNVLVFHGGLFGMGLASALSYYIALAVLLLHFFRRGCQLKLELHGVPWHKTWSMLVQGSATAEHKILRTMLSATLNRVVLSVGGAIAVAALTVINSLNLIFNSVGQGMGASTLMITGMMYGEGNRKGLRDVQNAFIRISVQVGAVMLLLSILFAPALVRLFMHTGGEAEAMAIQGMHLMGVYYFVYSITMCMKNYFQGTQNTAIRRNRGQKTSLADALLFLPASFGIPASDRIDFTLHSMEQVQDASVRTGEFCLNHGADARTGYLTALCVEEMAGNVIRHGFSDGKKHSLDVSVCRADNGWILRFRDDCKSFSPMEYHQIHHPEDPVENIGIRLVFGIANDIKYLNTMKLNNVIITF